MPYSPSPPFHFTIIESAAYVADQNSNKFYPPADIRGVRVYVNATDSAATPSVVFSIQVHDAVNDVYHTLLSSAAVTGAGTAVLEVSPGAGVVANVSTGGNIGTGFRVNCNAADADSLTYSVIGEWLQ